MKTPGFDALKFVCDHDGRESMCKITAPVTEEHVLGVLRDIVTEKTVTVMLRTERGGIPRLLRLWANEMEEREQPYWKTASGRAS